MKRADCLLERARQVVRECRLSRADQRRAMCDVRRWIGALRRSGVADARIVISVETDCAGWARLVVGAMDGGGAFASAPSSQEVH